MPKPATITRDTDADTKARLWRAAAAKLTLEECRELIAAAPEARGRFGRRGARKGAAPAAKPAKAKAAAKKKPAARKKKSAAAPRKKAGTT